MTVKELKEKLNEFDDELKIMISVKHVDGVSSAHIDEMNVEDWFGINILSLYGDEDNL